MRLDLTPLTSARLTETEVFKNAMTLYDGIVTEIERGAGFLIRDKAGNVSEFRMFL